MSAQIRWLCVIVDRGKGKYAAETLALVGVNNGRIILGKGTAPSEITNILGIGETEKDILVSLVDADNIRSVLHSLSEKLSLSKAGMGIAFTLCLSSISQSGAELTKTAENADNFSANEVNDMEDFNLNKYELAVAVIGAGMCETAMASARKSGAHGGSVVRSRDFSDDVKTFLGITLHPEKEILLILAERQIIPELLKQLCADIQEQHGEHCVCFSVPVENAIM